MKMTPKQIDLLADGVVEGVRTAIRLAWAQGQRPAVLKMISEALAPHASALGELRARVGELEQRRGSD
jgi:hypothetical protein